MPKYIVRKTFGHDLGISCAFRQWRAKDSHCKFVHGYALAFDLAIGCDVLDERNWCFDFGDFQSIKHLLVSIFDHKLVLAMDDPALNSFSEIAHGFGALDLVVLPAVGCEAFASYIFDQVAPMVKAMTEKRACLISVTVREHGANSATYRP